MLIHLIFKLTVTPNMPFLPSNADVVIVSISVAVNPPCNPPERFVCSFNTLNSALQTPSPIFVIVTYFK